MKIYKGKMLLCAFAAFALINEPYIKNYLGVSWFFVSLFLGMVAGYYSAALTRYEKKEKRAREGFEEFLKRMKQ